MNRFLSALQQNARAELPFWSIVAVLMGLAYFAFPHPEIAMWMGFAIAGYSAIANDSIQTLGTFLSSNRNMPWWALWLFIGGILVAAHVSGWHLDGGDIAFGRLEKIPQPQNFQYLQLAAPIILVVLTRYKMPVSTTFLILSVFSGVVVIQKMLTKTFLGYGIAFLAGFLIWAAVVKMHKAGWFKERRYNLKIWRVFQALSTGFLWYTWVTHDTANVAVFLPRTLTMNEMMMAVGFLFLVIGFIMYRRGGRIQSVVTEKTDVIDIRAATMIDLVYAFILFYFKQMNSIPMSTTWVFLGLLAGRELALSGLSDHPKPYIRSLKLVFKDMGRAGFGLLISLIIAFLIIA